MIRFIVCLISLCSVAAMAEVKLDSTFKKIKLEEFTSMHLDIMPDAGTQLIFPFLLDNPELKPTLKISLTNSNGFTVPHSADDIKATVTGQNTITIMGVVNESAPGAVYLGNLFITLGGYNLSISLKTTLSPKKHISNIVFDIADEERNHLVERTVEYKTRQLDEAYKQKLATLGNNASNQSLNHIAKLFLTNSTSKRYKDSGDIFIDGSRIDVFADRMTNYGDSYSVLWFELNNRSNRDFDIFGIDLVVGESNTLLGSYSCDKDLRGDTAILCTYAFSQRVDSKDKMNLVIRTNRGQAEFAW